jgi:hypothetical protein
VAPLYDPALIDEEIYRILATLQSAMRELQVTLDEHGLDDEAAQIARHIREMSDLLSDKVMTLDDSQISNGLRSMAAKVMSEVVLLERALRLRRLH